MHVDVRKNQGKQREDKKKKTSAESNEWHVVVMVMPLM